MRKVIGLVGTMGALVALSACTHTKATGFGNRNAPNEFAVTRSPPLVIPPDFALRPPKPGAPRPQEASPSTLALSAMFGGTVTTTPGQEALVGAAGGARDPGVRSGAGDPQTTVVDKGTTTKDILAAPAGAGQSATATTPQ
jgi:Protein of unknown function (DUF3035)